MMPPPESSGHSSNGEGHEVPFGHSPGGDTSGSDTPFPESFSKHPTPFPFPANDEPVTFNPDAQELLDAVGLGRRKAPLPEILGYVIEKELGRGGMGVVFQAIDTRLKRAVAVKMIRAELATSTDVARFEAEAVAVAAVRHPNVIQVFGSNRHNGDSYFVMEYLPGGSLAKLLETCRLDPQQAATLVAKLADGVHAAHIKGLIHRDIKPGNVLFDEHGEPKLSDFGLAKHHGSTLTHTEAMLGTPAYMPPEQAGGQSKFVDRTADVYGLGVLLYECLTGRRPFSADNHWNLLQQVQLNPPPPPSDSVVGLPRDLELICLKCLEKNPRDRYPTAEALRDDLRRFLRGDPVTVRRTPAVAMAFRWARKNPKDAVMVAAAVFAIMLVVAGLFRYESRLANADRSQKEEQRARKAAEELANTQQRLATAAALAKTKAEQAKEAADRLARNQSLTALVDRVRRRTLKRSVGWTWEVTNDVHKSAEIVQSSPDTSRTLRDMLADAALSPDMRYLGVVAGNFVPGAIAASPTEPVVAIAERRSVSLLSPHLVRLINTTNGRRVRELAFSPGFVRIEKRLELDSVRSVAFSRDGSKLFVGTFGGTIHRFDLRADESKPDRSWRVDGSVERLEVAPGERRLFVRLNTSELRAYSLDGDSIPLPRPKSTCSMFTVHPLHGTIAISHGSTAEQLNAESLNLDVALPSRLRTPVMDLKFSPDGQFLYAACDDTVCVLDPESFACRGEFFDPGLQKVSHDDTVMQIVVSPSGDYLATVGRYHDRTVKVWQTGTQRFISSVTIPGSRPIALAWSHDDRTLFATGTNETFRYEIRPAAAQTVVGRQRDPIERAAFTPDGEGFVTYGTAPSQATSLRRLLMRGWFDPMRVPDQVFVPGSRRGTFGFAQSPTSSRMLVATQSAGFRTWDPPGDLEPAHTTAGNVRLATFDVSGRTVWAIHDRTKLCVWDSSFTTPRPRQMCDTRTTQSSRAPYTLEALAVGDTRAIAGGSDGSVHILDTECVAPLATLHRHGDAITCVAIRDDRLAAVGTQNGAVSLYHLGECRELVVMSAHSGPVTAIAFSRDGNYLVTGSKNHSFRMWHRYNNNGRYEAVLTLDGLPSGVADLRFSPIDDRLMVVLDQERALRIWDIPRLHQELAATRMEW